LVPARVALRLVVVVGHFEEFYLDGRSTIRLVEEIEARRQRRNEDW
jgi:hypothetical protein